MSVLIFLRSTTDWRCWRAARNNVPIPAAREFLSFCFNGHLHEQQRQQMEWWRQASSLLRTSETSFPFRVRDEEPPKSSNFLDLISLFLSLSWIHYLPIVFLGAFKHADSRTTRSYTHENATAFPSSVLLVFAVASLVLRDINNNLKGKGRREGSKEEVRVQGNH